jgi:small-conductance mechanosensitive channel
VTRFPYELSLLGAAIVAGALSLFPALTRFRWPLRWGGVVLALCAAVFFAGQNFHSLDDFLPNDLPALKTALEVALWFVGALIGTSILKFALRRWVFPKAGQPRARKLFVDLMVGLVYLVAGIGILNALFGPPLSGLLATSGIVAVVAGLALQSTLADLFSGLALNVERPFRAGDWINVNGSAEGQILEINWRATRLKTRAGDLVVVPNSVLAKSVVTNHYWPSRTHLVAIGVTFGHEVDPDVAADILLQAGRGLPLSLADPAPSVFLLSCGALGIVYELDLYVADYVDGPQVTSAALRQIWHEAKKRGVTLAIPSQEILLDRAVEPSGSTSPGRARSRRSA